MTTPSNEPCRDDPPPPRVLVWDPFVRILHWTVAVAFLVAYVSEDDFLTVHVWAGYTIGALVVARILWGFVGPRHARFGDFVCAPWAAWRYALDLVAFRARRHLGHSPAGGVMVLLLLAGLLATAWSGLELHAVENGAGPLASTVPGTQTGTTSASRSVLAAVPAARADDDGEEREHRGSDDFWEEVHEFCADLVLALVVLHVLGVALASVVHRENLVRSMVNGVKRE